MRKLRGKGAWTMQAETLESRYRVRPHDRSPTPSTEVLHRERAGKVPAHGSPRTRKRPPGPPACPRPPLPPRNCELLRNHAPAPSTQGGPGSLGTHGPCCGSSGGRRVSQFPLPYLRLLPEGPRGQLDRGAPQDPGGRLGQLGLGALSRPTEERRSLVQQSSLVGMSRHHSWPRRGGAHGQGAGTLGQ